MKEPTRRIRPRSHQYPAVALPSARRQRGKRGQHRVAPQGVAALAPAGGVDQAIARVVLALHGRGQDRHMPWTLETLSHGQCMVNVVNMLVNERCTACTMHTQQMTWAWLAAAPCSAASDVRASSRNMGNGTDASAAPVPTGFQAWRGCPGSCAAPSIKQAGAGEKASGRPVPVRW